MFCLAGVAFFFYLFILVIHKLARKYLKLLSGLVAVSQVCLLPGIRSLQFPSCSVFCLYTHEF